VSYLDHYGEGDERREKFIKKLLVSALIVIIAATTLYFLFKNFREERQVKRFFELLKTQNYRQAYALWGCTEKEPCRDYAFDRFMADWGPSSPYAQPDKTELGKTRSCGSGVIVTTKVGDREDKLWVQRGSLLMGFSPWPTCPASGR
jgi:hypothetical protein